MNVKLSLSSTEEISNNLPGIQLKDNDVIVSLM